MPKIDVYKSSYLVYGSAGNIDMLSTEEFFYFQKGKVNYSKAYSGTLSRRNFRRLKAI